MLVTELIQKLSQLPENSEVIIESYGYESCYENFESLNEESISLAYVEGSREPTSEKYTVSRIKNEILISRFNLTESQKKHLHSKNIEEYIKQTEILISKTNENEELSELGKTKKITELLEHIELIKAASEFYESEEFINLVNEKMKLIKQVVLINCR